MMVAVDIEWITLPDRRRCPTQLAAVRMDSKGWMAEKLSCTITSPELESFAETEPDSEKTKNDNTTDAAEAIKAFFKWLRDDDELLWWKSQASDVFCHMVHNVGSDSEKMRFRFTAQIVSLRDYIYRFIKTNHPQLFVPPGANAYILASLLGINHKNTPHHSLDNACMICMVIQKLHFTQSELDTPPENIFGYSEQKEKDIKYQYDEGKRIVHISGCDKIIPGTTKGYGGLKKALKRSYNACPCCRKELSVARKENNISILDRIQTAYAYSNSSRIFHTTNCHMLYSAKKLLGVNYYDTCLEKGLRPCKVCKPVRSSANLQKRYPFTPQKTRTVNKYGIKEQKALKRYIQALSDRKKLLYKSETISKDESDIFILTHPAYVFWAGTEGSCFHLRNCSKTIQLQKLQGFSRYDDAIRAGFKPCKLCHPTKNSDLFYSFPLWSHPELRDNLPRLVEHCQKLGLKQKITTQYLYLWTPIGKWRVYLNQTPVHLDHINNPCDLYEEEYHRQPRIFFSVTDAVSYILRHDKVLLTVNAF